MITDYEFLLARQYNRDVVRQADDAQSIINAKNHRLVALANRVAALEAELEVERARRRRAEFLLARH